LFLVSAILKLSNLPAAMAEQEAYGLHPSAFWAGLTIAVEFIGSLLVIYGRFVWLAAGALGVFTALTVLIAHPFWTMQGEARLEAMTSVLEHVGLIGGLVLTVLVAEQAKRKARK
jgi:uncharacterized membrane protein YphA (DoxX/SURF4 family)